MIATDPLLVLYLIGTLGHMWKCKRDLLYQAREDARGARRLSYIRRRHLLDWITYP